ncbi:GGDEF domain-containing protein [Sulfurospirillum arcachonense]|uniref:GGDEF domain-containing protein n=1 Tax=Sulfurospirillum arcachonense TaxID=57666 RepID=UPI00046AB429|nr:GGDEF domain-containing protein [Sulfurospirillum arcachonense]
MLYSESKERENRFIISLKIGFPFAILTLILFYIFKISTSDIEVFILLVLLIPIYIYYIFYLIYTGFKTTVIDPTTRTFTRKEILEKINTIKNKSYESTVILIKVDNIMDINERYGITNADNILKIFTKKLDKFLKNYNFKNISIGKYTGGHFLLILKGREKELKHLITIFSKELKNIGINNIEIKIDYSLINSNYDENVNNIIKKLISLLEEHKNNIVPNIKPNEFEKIICNAIDEEKFILKYQPSYNKNTNTKILEVLAKIYSKSEGMLSKTQIQRVVNHMGYETIFDKKIFSILLKQLENEDLSNKKVSVKISPVTLRNTEFRQYLNQLFFKSPLKEENFILEFSEDKSYKEIKRFKEILNQYKKSGFKIGLDNFGGDNCSLEYIKNLPIDIVKFDIEYTKNIDDKRYKIIMNAYKNLLKDLGIEVMIKFVDKKELLEKVEKFEFDYIQGFIISKPKSLKQLEESL